MTEGFENLGFDNFDPDTLANQTASATLFVVAIDTSGSISGYVNDMNKAMKELFMGVLKNCHKKDEIVIKGVMFDKNVRHKSGFRPITGLTDDYLKVDNLGGATALYDGVYEGLDALIKYRTDLEDQGIDVKSNLFIITDGGDNQSKVNRADEVKVMVESLRQNEAWINSFTITMLGVGQPSVFEHSCVEMGLDPTKCLVTINHSAEEMRRIIGVVSQSASASASATANTPSF